MIRLATPGDLPAIEELVAAAYQPWADLIGVRPKPMDDDYAAHVAAGRIHLLCEVTGPDILDDETEVLGLVVLAPEPDALLVDNVAVRPDRHGGGLGRRLLAFAEDRAAALGLPALRLYTNARMESNIALYGRLGYEITERRQVGPREVVFMRKRLAPETSRG